MTTPTYEPKHYEPQESASQVRLNWLRAAVLGANDGIVSVAGIVVGVAGATTSNTVIITAGVAGVVAGALSMAAGEFISVSSQKDSEKALLEKERQELIDYPAEELEELTQIYQHKGLSRTTARLVADELTKNDAFAAHVDAELGIDPHNLTNPTHAAVASSLAFLSGSIVPMVAIILAPEPYKVAVTFVSVIAALGFTGSLSAHAGGAGKRKAAIRVIIGGAIAMIVTYGIGRMIGISGL
ncbi:MAG: VIT family protein [Candidatus Saccharibacteria bacterium]